KCLALAVFAPGIGQPAVDPAVTALAVDVQQLARELGRRHLDQDQGPQRLSASKRGFVGVSSRAMDRSVATGCPARQAGLATAMRGQDLHPWFARGPDPHPPLVTPVQLVVIAPPAQL